MIAETAQLFEHLGVDIDPTAPVSELETSKKQLLEIAKALHANAKLFILDEPTTALNNTEIEHLFSIVRRLRDEGKSFIFISHKMTEIFEIADRYTVLRNGRLVGSGDIGEITPTEVTRLMVGESYSDADIYAARELGAPVLELENYSGHGFENVTLVHSQGRSGRLYGLEGRGRQRTDADHFRRSALDRRHAEGGGSGDGEKHHPSRHAPQVGDDRRQPQGKLHPARFYIA